MKLKPNRLIIGFSVGLIVIVGGFVATCRTTKTVSGTITANTVTKSDIATAATTTTAAATTTTAAAAAATTATPSGMRAVAELKTKLVNYTVTTPVRENHTKEIQYTVMTPVYETREKTVTYTVCRMVPEVRTKTVNYTTCRMERETRQMAVEYKEIRFEPIDDQQSKAESTNEHPAKNNAKNL